MRRATLCRRVCRDVLNLSIHALREEGDATCPNLPPASRNFYPRPPRGGRPALGPCWWRSQTFLSTPSARRATHYHCHRPDRVVISIHALREEGDVLGHTVLAALDLFLSTPSARRATSGRKCDGLSAFHFYPRPPRGGRLDARDPMVITSIISIHALREEGDGCDHKTTGGSKIFLSTPSARRATFTAALSGQKVYNFYPRPPRGGRLTSAPRLTSSLLFLSTPSARRATKALSSIGTWIKKFLSTPSARRATAYFERGFTYGCNFYPRPPRGGRLPRRQHGKSSLQFLSTPSARRATRPAFRISESSGTFLSTPSARRAT